MNEKIILFKNMKVLFILNKFKIIDVLNLIVFDFY